MAQKKQIILKERRTNYSKRSSASWGLLADTLEVNYYFCIWVIHPISSIHLALVASYFSNPPLEEDLCMSGKLLSEKRNKRMNLIHNPMIYAISYYKSINFL